MHLLMSYPVHKSIPPLLGVSIRTASGWSSERWLAPLRQWTFPPRGFGTIYMTSWSLTPGPIDPWEGQSRPLGSKNSTTNMALTHVPLFGYTATVYGGDSSSASTWMSGVVWITEFCGASWTYSSHRSQPEGGIGCGLRLGYAHASTGPPLSCTFAPGRFPGPSMPHPLPQTGGEHAAIWICRATLGRPPPVGCGLEWRRPQ